MGPTINSRDIMKTTTSPASQEEPFNWVLFFLKLALVVVLVPLVIWAGVIAGFFLGAGMIVVIKTIGALVKS